MFAKCVQACVRFFARLKSIRRALNERAMERPSPRLLALSGVALVALMAAVLWIAPGTDRFHVDAPRDVMADYGLTPFVQRALVQAVIALDALLTGDSIFDIRFLAALYLMLYLPALYTLMRHLMERVRHLTSRVVIMALTVLVFGDSSLILRFASFDPQPVALIALLALAGISLSLTRRRASALPLLIIPLCVWTLVLCDPYCAVSGVCFSVLPLKLLGQKGRRPLYRAGCALCALALSATSFYGGSLLIAQNSPLRRYHALTRGVLLHADDPERALAELGLSPRFSVLKSAYGDEPYPVVLPERGAADEGFLNAYDTGDVLAYYLRHPGALITMLDGGVRASFDAPQPDKTTLPSLWSALKKRVVPRTLGFYMLLALALIALCARRGAQDRAAGCSPASVIALLLLCSLAQLGTAILLSGDAELPRASFQTGVLLDAFILLTLGELLRRLNLHEARVNGSAIKP